MLCCAVVSVCTHYDLSVISTRLKDKCIFKNASKTEKNNNKNLNVGTYKVRLKIKKRI